MRLDYNETLTFYKVKPDGYGDNKRVMSSANVQCIFVQGTGFSRTNYQEAVIADATCYPDFQNDFIVDNYNRLEGFHILAPLFNAPEEKGWYIVTKCTVNRDHLLSNQIDNIELLLKKTEKILFVS